MNNVDAIAASIRSFFANDPDGQIFINDIARATGVAKASIQPVLQWMCGAASSPYEFVARAEELRGVLVRHPHSHGAETSFTLSEEGRHWLGLSPPPADASPVPLVDVETIGAVLRSWGRRRFSSVDFAAAFAHAREAEYRLLVERVGTGGPGSGRRYSVISHLARSLGRYRRRSQVVPDLEELRIDGSTWSEATGRTALWAYGDELDNVLADLQEIAQDSDLTEPEREALRKARIGQGRFRKQVLAHWANRCPITNCADVRLLVASHIRRWCDSDKHAKLDPYNGLALTPNVDRLFDRHLISFDESGRLLRASRLDPAVLVQLSISSDVAIQLQAGHHPFMASHRARLYELDAAATESGDSASA